MQFVAVTDEITKAPVFFLKQEILQRMSCIMYSCLTWLIWFYDYFISPDRQHHTVHKTNTARKNGNANYTKTNYRINKKVS